MAAATPKADGRCNRNRHSRGRMVDLRALALHPEQRTGSRCVRASASDGRRQTQVLRHARPRCAADDVWKTDADDTARESNWIATHWLLMSWRARRSADTYPVLTAASPRLAHVAWPAAGAKASPVVQRYSRIRTRATRAGRLRPTASTRRAERLSARGSEARLRCDALLAVAAQPDLRAIRVTLGLPFGKA